jgi:hypothetical protein
MTAGTNETNTSSAPPSLDTYVNASGGATVTPGSSPQVYWGATPLAEYSTAQQRALALGVPIGPGVDKIFTVDQADGYFLSSILPNPQLLEQYRKRFEAAGFDVSNNQKLRTAWTTAVNWASDSYVKGGRRLTPWDAIDEIGAANGGANQTTGVKDTTIQNVNNTDVKVDLSSPQTARAYLESSMLSSVGRSPTSKEIANFREALNQMEKANPVVNKTTGTRTNSSQGTRTVDASGATTNITGSYSADNTNTVQSGGMERAQYATDFAKSAKDYAEYQTETTYMNALMQAIQSPVNV